MGVLRYFYVSGVDLDWSEDGVEVKFDFQNYWTPRWDEETRQRTARSHTGTSTSHSSSTVRNNARSGGESLRPISAPGQAPAPTQSTPAVNHQATAANTNLTTNRLAGFLGGLDNSRWRR